MSACLGESCQANDSSLDAGGPIISSTGDDLFTDFGEFFEPLDPELLFECSATVRGDVNAVYVYPDRVEVDSPEVESGHAEIPLTDIETWTLGLEPDAVHLRLIGPQVWGARLPKMFTPVLEVALGKVMADRRAA